MKHQLEAVIFISLGIATGWAWHQWYVKPHDEARYQILECMGNEAHVRETYEACVAKLRQKDQKER